MASLCICVSAKQDVQNHKCQTKRLVSYILTNADHKQKFVHPDLLSITAHVQHVLLLVVHYSSVVVCPFISINASDCIERPSLQ